ncbi:MAG: bifunctional phosphoglucose/phosphomannose isomerase [candidate division WOR-3 bacterium]|nr:bifunctional phosphoglucose/phosphomannose isomerase [candidate division WOR-3 bacterium]MCX7947650.1 bifunctional phosphoglucose/phosphomannose isomerase [candidate division WOR-3 bacterium]MDW8150528.1 bifunctional phosphoglucose/phosphomannose isomerase [candidate division WOR-3 bacterium]
MIEIIRSIPKQLKESFEFPTYKVEGHIKKIGICGMGGSGIVGDIVKGLIGDKIIIEVVKDYHIPSYLDANSLVFIISYSGNTEETISAFESAFKNGCRIIIITSGGKLKEIAEKYEIPLILIPKGYPPRGAIGYMLGSVLLNLEKNGIVQISRELKESIEFLDKLTKEFESHSSIAFEIASKLYLRLPIIYSTKRTYHIAYRWQTQINENAKSFCHINVLPEMNHNEINGIKNPQSIISRSWLIFIYDESDDERIKRRIEITSEILKDSVMGVSTIKGKGETYLHKMLYLIILGDYVSYFLARMYNEDPYSIPRIEELKTRMKF